MADVVIDAAVFQRNGFATWRTGAYYVTEKKAYFPYIDANQNIVFEITTDNFQTIDSTVIIDATTEGFGIDCWADWETPGWESGKKIHLTYLDSLGNKHHYGYIDITDDSWHAVWNGAITNAINATTRDYAETSITRAVSGRLYKCHKYRDGTFTVNFGAAYSDNEGASWTNMVSPWNIHGPDENSFVQYFPHMKSGRENDIVCIFWDSIDSKVYVAPWDSTGPSWGGRLLICNWSTDTGSSRPSHGVVNGSDIYLILRDAHPQNANCVTRTFIIDKDMTVTEKTSVIGPLSSPWHASGASLSYDIRSNRWYAAYQRGNLVAGKYYTKVYYKYSDDYMVSWSPEQSFQDTGGEFQNYFIGVCIPHPTGGGRWGPPFDNFNTSIMYSNYANSQPVVGYYPGRGAWFIKRYAQMTGL